MNHMILNFSRNIAKAVLFLASGQASYINGTGLVVHGGLGRINLATTFALLVGTEKISESDISYNKGGLE